jgi:hypothetical protein
MSEIEDYKELINLSAISVGIKGYWIAGFEHLGLCTSEKGYPPKTWWNPLEDDGDCLRLATYLGISISMNITCVSVYTIKFTLAGIFIKESCLDQDTAIAVRRAVVRVAAEIGRVI